MEISTPTWNSGNQSYTFRILKSNIQLEQVAFLEQSEQELNLPANQATTNQFVAEFLEKTKKYFTSPLTNERVLRHLRHSTVKTEKEASIKKEGWYKLQWQPFSMTIKTNDFLLSWQITEATEAEPMIPTEFTNATTPRAQSPVPEQTRNIQIHDSLIPVGDLPLSDLPPLSFETEQVDPAHEEMKRRIREARLKVQLAKLKAQRMKHRYFERYGHAVEESEDSSEFSSESEEEEELSFEPHSNA
jgi:hypothetical protein